MIRRPPGSTQSGSSAASDVYKGQWVRGVGEGVGRGVAVAGLVAVGVGVEVGVFQGVNCNMGVVAAVGGMDAEVWQAARIDTKTINARKRAFMCPL